MWYVRCLTTDIWCLMPDIWCDVFCLVSYVLCMMSYILFLTSDVLYLIYVMSDVWFLMSDVWCLMFNVWCLMSYVLTYPCSKEYHPFKSVFLWCLSSSTIFHWFSSLKFLWREKRTVFSEFSGDFVQKPSQNCSKVSLTFKPNSTASCQITVPWTFLSQARLKPRSLKGSVLHCRISPT